MSELYWKNMYKEGKESLQSKGKFHKRHIFSKKHLIFHQFGKYKRKQISPLSIYRNWLNKPKKNELNAEKFLNLKSKRTTYLIILKTNYNIY